MASFRLQPGEVVVPRFRCKWNEDLQSALQALGMIEPFKRDRADFSGMSPPAAGLFVSSIRHMTFLDVSEKGTEAAAATAMERVGSAQVFRPPSPFRMVVDRPFFLAIRDKLSGILLFMGSVREP